ncbi:hypothetical protein SAMD00019534_040850 [Acytostelium subglobosum LB1]|uniref:hypothetical protein n=1 Tax=Acytostelium subglobosum LB1 TaxID=1410327 RepID=UPI000644917C|nr:hypothetical protein SAMD00019534_040850 [Acytostelium subglobosum LB1]GAM20910.1 hypothetical protein SAMD00019534_040850 [Acytostelium subglobosum LB1]|eukprot:XP_012756044.1 hypothetical protein SAMD00019534_040850 [Acytostelium subglobosum LB1]
MSIKSHDDYIKFERLCKDSFQKPEDANRIEEILQQYFLNPNFLVEYKSILQFSKNSYVIAQVCRGLLRCVTQYWNSIPAVQRTEIKTTIWYYLESLPQIEIFSWVSLLKLYSRLLKFSWQEETNKAPFLESIQDFMKKSPDHHCIALRVLKDIICEFNEQAGDHLSTSQHRNLSISLRDNVLMKFFTISIDSLKYTLNTPDKNDKSKEYAMDLSLSCLSFDFIKTTSIDTSEEILTIQIPSNWKSIFDDPNTTQLFFRIYKTHYSPKSLECLVHFASIRKSLFQSEDERTKFITNIFKGTREILQNSIGLNFENNHLAFCRILERIKTNYLLSQLVAIEGYQEWIGLLSAFTIETLKNPQFSPNSIHYLLSLWSKFVSSIIYIKGDTSKANLEKYTPLIMEAFLNSKVNGSSFLDDEDDNLMDFDKMVEMKEHIPYLGRLTYALTAKQIIQMFDHTTQKMSMETSVNNLTILERQCAWLVYIIGCLITGRTAVNSSEEYDSLDGDLSVRVFKLIDYCDKKLQHDPSSSHGRTSRVALELSIIHFMQSFRKIYIGENTLSSSKVYPRISELLGATDHTTILYSIIRKIGFNCKFWCDADDVIKRSLELFWDSVNGHSTSKILLNTPITHDLLQNHGAEVFPFLDNNPNSRHRMTLYQAIGKLLFTDENTHYFEQFMLPFEDTLSRLHAIQSIDVFRSEDTKSRIIGLMRDLRGLTSSAMNKKFYCQVFEMLNTKFPVLQKIITAYYDCPEVTTAVLRLLAEYTNNKQARMNFDSSSPNGFIIFKETSKILASYGSLLINLPCTSQQLYKYKLKGISLLMSIFTKCLTGNYCNFGAFEYFGDKSFHNLLDMTMQLLVSVTMDEIMNFPKVSKIYMQWMEALCSSHTQTIIELNSNYFALIMYSILRGIDSQEISISTQVCVSLDKIITLCYQHTKKKDSLLLKTVHNHLTENPTLLPQIVDKLFNVIIFEDNLNQWSVSKPLLGCVVFVPDTFSSVKQRFAQLNPNSQDKIETIFTQLMADIVENLDTKNRDRFTQNVAAFRREMRLLGGASGARY